MLPLSQHHPDRDPRQTVPAGREAAPSVIEVIHGMTGALQTTLQVEEQVELFAERIAKVVPLDGVSYAHEEYGLEVKIGKRGPYRCSYRLTLLNDDLGEIVFTRRVRFEERELQRLETLICALLHPLRNGLLYLNAVRAAHRDPLTGIGNRAAFETTLEREVKLARRHQQPLAIIAIDLDLFKRINDNYGHVAGDTVLRNFAEVGQSAIRDSDLLFRYGGEEFVAILASTDEPGAMQVAERIRERVEKSVCQCGKEWLGVTASLGVAILKGDESPVELLEKADAAMYTAKNRGRNQVVAYAE